MISHFFKTMVFGPNCVHLNYPGNVLMIVDQNSRSSITRLGLYNHLKTSLMYSTCLNFSKIKVLLYPWTFDYGSKLPSGWSSVRRLRVKFKLPPAGREILHPKGLNK